MNKLIPTLMLGLAAVAAYAQKIDPFDYIVSDIRIMQDRKVQNELGITASQRTRMNQFADRHRQRMMDLQKSLNGRKPTTEQQKQIELKLVGYMSDLKHNVCGVLTPSQLKRLREITLQGYGWGALADDRVAKRVGATPEQAKRIRAALQSAQTRAAALQKQSLEPILAQYRGLKPKDSADAKRLDAELQGKLRAAGSKDRGQLVAIQGQALSTIRSILTPKQRAAYVALMGRKFVSK